MNKTILVTGIAGFIGSNLAHSAIKRGYEVIGIDDLSQGLKSQIPSEVIFFEEDILSIGSQTIERLNSYEFCGIFHLAAKNCIQDCENAKEETFRINTGGSIKFFETIKHLNFEKFINAESSALYEGSHKLPSRIEEIDPISCYSYSKLAARYALQELCLTNSKQYYGLRYFNAYGPHQDYRRSVPPVMSAFIINRLIGKNPIIYGDGLKRRDFINIKDIDNFHLMICDELISPGTYNLGSGKNYSVNEILILIDKVIHKNKLEVDFKENKEFEAQENLADISLTLEQGWQPEISLEAGLSYMISDIIQNIHQITAYLNEK